MRDFSLPLLLALADSKRVVTYEAPVEYVYDDILAQLSEKKRAEHLKRAQEEGQAINDSLHSPAPAAGPIRI